MPLKMRKLSTLSSAFGLAVALFLSLTFLVSTRSCRAILLGHL